MEIHVFDLDKTLICADSYDLWHEFLHERGILGADFIAKNNEMIALYDEGKLDMMGYLAFSVEALSAMSIDKVAQIMPEFLREKIAPIVRKECEIWRNLRPNLVISATPSFVSREVVKFIGFNEAIGVNLVRKNGFYTSEFIPPLSFQAGKIDAFKIWWKKNHIEICVKFGEKSPQNLGKFDINLLESNSQDATQKFDTLPRVHFYTDSINDLAMCEFSDVVTCVSPDQKLRAKARENGWEILDI